MKKVTKSAAKSRLFRPKNQVKQLLSYDIVTEGNDDTVTGQFTEFSIYLPVLSKKFTTYPDLSIINGSDDSFTA
jgi:hypothetical protein